MHVKNLAARYEALISSASDEPPSPQPQPPAKRPPSPPPPDDPDPPLPSGPGTVSALTRRIEAVVSTDAALPLPTDPQPDHAPKLRPALLRDASDPNTSHVTASSSAPTASIDALRFDSVPSAARLALDKTLGVAAPSDDHDEARKLERHAEFLRHEAFRRRIEQEELVEDDEDDDNVVRHDDDRSSTDGFDDAPNDFIPPISEGSLDDIEDAEPVSDGSLSPNPDTFRRIPTALSVGSDDSTASDHAHDRSQQLHHHPSYQQQQQQPSQHTLLHSSNNVAPPNHLSDFPSMTRALSFSPDIRALSPDIRVIASPVFELEPPVAPLPPSTSAKPITSIASASASASPASLDNAFDSPGQSFANRFLNPPSFKLQPRGAEAVTSSSVGTKATATKDSPAASRRPRAPSSPQSSFAASSHGARSSFAPSSHGAPSSSLPSAHATARRVHSHGLASTPSHKKLPKAKVILARRRAEPLSTASSAHGSAMSPPMSRHSLDLPAARQLVREYSHPRELFAGHVSLLPSTPPESPPLAGVSGAAGASVPAFKPLAHGANALAMRPHSQPAGPGVGAGAAGVASSNNAKAVRNRYDDFMDPDDLPGRRHRERGEAVTTEDGFPAVSNSKKRYNNKKWFGGADEKEKERRRNERVERSSSVISGALDRVSMAADPWIDFITDTNGVGIPNKTGGPIRRAMKRLFGRKGHPTLIKDVD